MPGLLDRSQELGSKLGDTVGFRLSMLPSCTRYVEDPRRGNFVAMQSQKSEAYLVLALEEGEYLS